MRYNIFMAFIKKNWYRVSFLIYAFFVPVFRLFAETDSSTSGKIVNPINANSIQEFIKTLLTGVIKIGMPIVALAIIYCGFLFVSARGNTEKLTKAKDALLYTLIGAGILLGSWAIAQLISETVISLY